MDKVNRIAKFPAVQEALNSFASDCDRWIDAILAVQRISAPTFFEVDRANFIESRFKQLGLQSVFQDELHNVYGRLPGLQPDTNSPVVISAHSDTVFPAGTDLQVSREGDRIYGPGIGDNSTGVAGLFSMAATLKKYNLGTNSDIWFVSNVGEEGLGDLVGMRAVVKRFGRHAAYIIVEGGLFGQVSHEAIGVRRFRVDVSAPGGHSWGSFGQPSAVHEIAKIISAINRIRVPVKPKTSYNVGVVDGGTSINTIAASASMLLDLRSEDSEELSRLVNQVYGIIERAKKQSARLAKGVTITIIPVGNRPAGHVPRSVPLVGWAEQAFQLAGKKPVVFVSGSTDANIPLSMGIPAVCVGLTESANSHRLDEYIEVGNLPEGLKQLLLLILAAADYRGGERS